MSTAVSPQTSLAVIATWSDIGPGASEDIGDALTSLLADVFALCLNTNDFHEHMSGRHRHFRDYRSMPNGQAEMIVGADMIAQQVQVFSSPTIGTIGKVVSQQRFKDSS